MENIRKVKISISWNKDSIEFMTDLYWKEIIEKDIQDNEKEYIHIRQADRKSNAVVIVKNIFVKKELVDFLIIEDGE